VARAGAVIVAFAINLRPKAFADIRGNVAWLATHFSAAKATGWQLRANSSIRSLENDPERCAVADEASDVGVELRELLFGGGGMCSASCSPSTAKP
jgi:plasmid stabilization system protein ParE